MILTPQEVRLCEQLVLGKSNKEIAYELGLAEGTVKIYLSVMYIKMGVFNRTQAALLYRDHKEDIITDKVTYDRLRTQLRRLKYEEWQSALKRKCQ